MSEQSSNAKYAIDRQIAKGGMGAVLSARDGTIGRTVAMKVMLPGMAQSSDARSRFEREAQVLGQLEHPNIVPMHELGTDTRGQLFYTMKLVKGETLREVLDHIKAGQAEAVAQYSLIHLLTVFQKICDAVSYAHAKGVIHRDLKPENIMLGKYGEVLVMDWGLAKVLGGGRSALAEGPSLSPGQDLQRPASDRLSTMEGSVIGTPQYMAPEQAEGRLSDLDERTDIFSLGAILYSILTLRPPAGGTTLQEVLDNVRSGYIPPPVFYNTAPRKLPDGSEGKKAIKLRHCPDGLVPESLSAVAMKAMAKDAAQRYQTVTEFQADLTKYQTGFATSAEEVSLGKQIKLLIRRNKAVVATAFTAWLIITVLLFWFVVRVTQERNRSAASLTRLRATAPTMAAQAKSLVEGQKFDEALEQIELALELDGTNPDYHLTRANTLQALARLPEAIDSYWQVIEHRPDDAVAKLNLELCEQLLTENEGKPALTAPLKTKLLDALLAQKRQADAVPLSRELKRDTDTAETTIKTRLKAIMAQPGWKPDKLKRLPDGTFSIGLSGLKISDLSILDGLPISSLDIGGPDPIDLSSLPRLPLTSLSLGNRPITNLTALKGLKLHSLTISGTRISDLSPLAGMPLQSLYINGSRVSDLGPLRGLPLKRLEAGSTPIRDLRPLRDTPMEDLTISDCPVTSLDGLQKVPLKTLSMFNTPVEDVSPLRGSPVKEIWLNHCSRITDLKPLMDCKQLEALTVPTHTSDIAFFKSHPSLKRLSNHSIEYFGWTTSKIPTVAAFFEKHGARLERQVPMEKQLEKFRQSLIEQGNHPKDVPRYGFNSEGESDISLGKLKCSDISGLRGVAVTRFYSDSRSLVDLSPLAGAPLKILDIPQTAVSDLSPLKGAPLSVVRLYATRVKDLSPLRGMPLEKFLYQGQAGIDVSLLAEIPTLQEIIVPEDATGILALKRLPKLRLLSYRTANTSGLLPDQTAAEFWKQHGDRLARQESMEKQLEKFRQSLIQQGNAPDKVPQFAFDTQGGLVIKFDRLKCSDISDLRGVAVTKFECRNSQVRDLSPLQGAPLREIYLSSTPVTDISPIRGAKLTLFVAVDTRVQDVSPLRGMPLTAVFLNGSPVDDLAPLAEIPTLRDVILPAGAKNIELLKRLPQLQFIGYAWDGVRNRPNRNAAEFWKEFDAKQKK